MCTDLLGFGDSDKPAGHTYSLIEQADLLAALWRHYGVTETAVVAHDIGGSVALELLARQSEGRLATRVTRVVLLNSALYAGVSRPRLVQRLLAQPLVGPVLGRLVTERLFTRNLAAVFAPAHPLQREMAHEYWTAFQRRGTSPHMHPLLEYIRERTQHHARWEGVLAAQSSSTGLYLGPGGPGARRGRRDAPPGAHSRRARGLRWRT